ncbi:MAG: hypothetical protein HEQ19_00175 [Gloeotrichia echinulata CP02]
MTSRADEIQRLIADIDHLLANSSKRRSRLLSGQGTEEGHEVLERIRDFLVGLGENEPVEKEAANKPQAQPLRSPLLAKFVDQANIQSSIQQKQPDQEHNPVVLPQQLNSEFATLLMPLQAELSTLLQERATLVQEIRQLEQRRLHNYSLSQQLANQEQIISEFLQVLMSRLVPNLTPHVSQNLPSSPSSLTTSNQTNLEPISSTTAPFIESSDSTERLTRLATDLDQRLLSLDGTVNVVFEALQRNIHTYQESLSQALARMYSQGVQGEQLMASFVQNLTQYLQPPSLSSEPSWQGGEKNVTLPPSPTLVSSADTRESAVQPLTPSLAIINLEPPVASTTQELDAVVLPHTTSTPVTPTELPQNSFELDEVDQLYASLFGTDNVIDSTVEVGQNAVTNEVFTLSPSAAVLNIADTVAELPTNQVEAVDSPAVLNIAETTAELPTNQVEAVDSPEIMPDPWIEQPDVGLVQRSNLNSPTIQDPPLQPTDSLSQSWETLFFDEEPDPVPPISLSNLPPPEVLPTDRFLNQPTEAETITALTDLFPDVGSDPQPGAISSPTAATPASRSEVLIQDEEADRTDHYIPASANENLLSQTENQVTTIPDISLDAVQLQQLDRDLANFDGSLNSPLPPITNWDRTQAQVSAAELLTENQPSAFVSTSLSPVEQITEEKTIATDSNQQSSLLDNKLNNTEVSAPTILDAVWYLGIDLGTTGISAVLLNRSTFVVYPIYWLAQNQSGATSFQQSFRLPAEVYLPTASVPHGEQIIEQTAPIDVAQEKVSAPSSSATELTSNLYSAQLKPYLQVAIPYKSTRQKWEPVLQFNEFSAGPLIWVVRSLSKLLLTLKSDRDSTTQGLTAAAVGIAEPAFGPIINNITGVICTCPANSSEQYRFNVREAILTSKLIQHPQQVFFVEEAIASLLSVLDGANNEAVQLSDRDGLRPVNTSEHPFVGNTLALNIGATASEMALVDLPQNQVQLAHNDFMLHSFAYAGKGIEQDIICQLLLPPKSRQSRFELQDDDKTITTNQTAPEATGRYWQPSIPGLDRMRWHSLGLEELELPRVGEPDITARIRLQQRLESSLLGQAVLDAALALKLILQHQDSFTLDLADQRWVLQRRDLESQVLVPFVRRLNRELNKLLVARGIPTEAINQAILTGGMAAIPTVNRWLRQKLPNAKIIQDLYIGDHGAPNCSRVAYGLGMLPLHPQVLEVSRQQYTDYFLFTELLRLLPERTLSFGEIIQLFEGRGINTRTCQQRLMAFLEGELPSGLIPNHLDATRLTQSSRENTDYKAIASAPLFEKQGSLTYRPNSQQLLYLRRYLDAIKASTQQSLEEPYMINLALGTSK